MMVDKFERFKPQDIFLACLSMLGKLDISLTLESFLFLSKNAPGIEIFSDYLWDPFRRISSPFSKPRFALVYKIEVYILMMTGGRFSTDKVLEHCKTDLQYKAAYDIIIDPHKYETFKPEDLDISGGTSMKLFTLRDFLEILEEK